MHTEGVRVSQSARGAAASPRTTSSGRRIVEILAKNKSDYTDGDIEHMGRVVNYVRRHQAQKPNGDVEDSNWRYSLMNWGHDPLK